MLNKVLGVLIILIGIVLGMYFGIWILFVGGIMDIVGFLQSMIDKDLNGILLVWGILKMMFASFVGCVIFYTSVFIAKVIN